MFSVKNHGLVFSSFHARSGPCFSSNEILHHFFRCSFPCYTNIKSQVKHSVNIIPCWSQTLSKWGVWSEILKASKLGLFALASKFWVVLILENKSLNLTSIVSRAFCSNWAFIRLIMGSGSGQRISVGANTMARLSDPIMLVAFCSVTLKWQKTQSVN